MAADAAAQGAVEWAALFAVAPVAQKLGASASGAELYDIAVDALLELAELDKSTAETAHGRAFLLVEAAKARLLTEQLSRGELAPPPGVPAKLLARERSLLKEIEALDSAALAARDSGIPVRTHGERRADLTQQLNEVWDAIAKQDGAAVEYVTTRRGETPTLESIHDVVANAGLGRAVLSLFILRSRTVLFSARAGGSGYLVFQVSVGSDGWRDALRRFNRELPRSGGQDVLPPTWEAPLRPVLQLAGELVKGAWYVTIVPHGPASALPWTYLTRDWEGADEQQPAISTIPSLAMLARLQRRPRVAPGKPVVIGNPTGDLEYAEAEARATGAILGVEPLIGSVATRSALDEAAPTARTLHLACHAAFEEASPLDSHILLADGPWRAREALSLDLDAELVILSGCETGLLGSLAGEEAAGLAQAFLHAGARSVIVSLWPISDAATAEFMRVFHTHRAAGERVSVGLRAAATEVRCSHPHPWFWSGFLLVGADH